MMLLKPRLRLRRVTLGSKKGRDVLTEGGVRQLLLKFVPRDRLQDNPRVLRKLPKLRIQQPPHFVAGMVPRRAHIQGELSKRIDAFDVRR